jgi:predicted CXXCH cytochrome family protein
LAPLACVALGVPSAERMVPRPQPAPEGRAADLARQPAGARFVGEAQCASCHPQEAARWRGSHHQLAMQPANAATVLGDFADGRCANGDVVSRFSRLGDSFVARTDGADGALHDHPITHTFGVAPLQQYLVAFPGGRWQALGVAWDSRPRAAGGQRWFDLRAGEPIAGGDPLHWTGLGERWNSTCADCHSTGVRKGYDAAHDRYDTRFAEMSVACEACHGPGSRHVAWARGEDVGAARDHGLAIALDERHGVAWTRDGAGRPGRSTPRTSRREIEMCARCHARRGLLHEDDVHGQPVDDDFRVALLEDELYYPDGQIKAEVYEYGSFVQSRMFAAGVTCSDCHDPHRPDLAAADDRLCLQCHEEARYLTRRHHFHGASSAGARCVACHMPATTYMQVDPRRDHSLRVPRPDLTVALGVPNACNRCHGDRSATWAARTVERWYGHTPSGHQQFAAALVAADAQTPDAARLVGALVADRGQPGIARATAIERLARAATPAALEMARTALADAEPLVRRAAVHALADVAPALRASWLAPLTADPVRAVRLEVAAALAGVPPALLAPEAAAALPALTAELVAAQTLNADRPEAHLALATLHARQGALAEAEADLRQALALDPGFVPAAVDLADLYRVAQRDADAEPLLRAALARVPDNPPLLHALGLLMARQQRGREAIDWLGAAARAAPGNARYGYVYAVALWGDGRRDEARAGLEQVLARHPYDRDALAALLAFGRESGDVRRALACAERLAALAPDDAAIAGTLRQLRARLAR